MLSLERNGFTKEQVTKALHSGVVEMTFRYELLDKDNKKIKDLDNVISGEISVKSLANIKRTASFRLKEDPDINFLTDRIAPYCRLKIPEGRLITKSQSFLHPHQTVTNEDTKRSEGGYVEFPLGVFLLSSPKRSDENGEIFRDVDAYDGLQVLKDDRFSERYTIPAGTRYYDAVIDILKSAGITKYNIEYTDKTLSNAKDFEPGREKLFAVNDLLGAINYDGIQVDVYGYYNSSSYELPNQRSPEYTYRDDDQSVTLPGMEEELDLNSIYNQFVVVRTNEEQEPISATYTNDNPNSPVSTVNLGRTKTDYREVQDIADQESLNGYVQRIAHEATKIYGKLTFETGIMPFHDIDDVLQIEYSRLGITEKYIETEWSFPLQAGGTMSHEVRKVVEL